MDERSFSTEIRTSWELLKDVFEIGRSVASINSLPIDEVFRDIALSEEATYDTIFKTGISRSAYNILLKDYSFFQFTRQSSTSWRLGYFPNPWLAGAASAMEELKRWETLEEIGALSHEEATDLINDMPYLGSIPSIRFEYAPHQYKEIAHPTAHFHIGRHTNNRWPCSVKIGPQAFILLITKMYYSEAWSGQSRYFGSNPEQCMDLLLIERLAEAGVVHEFSDNERMSIYLGRNPPQILLPAIRNRR